MERIKACECKNIYLEEVIELINKGFDTIEKLQQELQIGTVCSMCLFSENDINGERPVHLDKLLKSIKGR